MKKIFLGVLFLFFTVNIFSSDFRGRKAIWWFPVGDDGINFTGAQQFFMSADKESRKELTKILHKDLSVLRENGYDTVTIRVPNSIVPWQRFNGSLDPNPTQEQLRGLIEYVDLLWSAGFYSILAFDWSTEPYPALSVDDPHANDDGIVPGTMFSVDPVSLTVVGHHPVEAFKIQVENVWPVRRHQAFKNKRTGEVLVSIDASIEDKKNYINIATVEELGWRAGEEKTGGRGFGKTEPQFINDGDILESVGSADWVPKYLSMIMRSKDYYPGLKNLVDHPGIAGWILIGEAHFRGRSKEFSYFHLSHDEFYKAFWGHFYLTIKSGSADQMALSYSVLADSYDDWSLGFLRNMKYFFMDNYPLLLPDLWGVELYQAVPEEAYSLSRRVLDSMVHGGPFSVPSHKIFVGEWAYSPRKLKEKLQREPSPEEYDKEQMQVVWGVRLALLEYGIKLDMHWGWWAKQNPLERTRDEDIMGLAYPLEKSFLGEREITGSSFYELRPAESSWQQFINSFRSK